MSKNESLSGMDINVSNVGYIENNTLEKTNKPKNKKTLKRFFKVLVVLVSVYIAIAVVERIVMATFGYTYMESVLEERYNEEFEYVGRAGYGDYEFNCASFPNEEILLNIDTKNNSFWNDDKWYDNYPNIKYDKQAEEALLKIVEEAFGKGAQVEINLYNEFKIPGDCAKKCKTLNDFMRYGLKYADIKILVVSPVSKKEKDTQEFLSLLKNNDYNIGYFNLYYFESKIRDYSNDRNITSIYSESIYNEFVSINDNFEIDEII